MGNRETGSAPDRRKRDRNVAADFRYVNTILTESLPRGKEREFMI